MLQGDVGRPPQPLAWTQLLLLPLQRWEQSSCTVAGAVPRGQGGIPSQARGLSSKLFPRRWVGRGQPLPLYFESWG